MFSTLLRLAGVPFFLIALASRLPFSMSIVGVMTAVSVVRGSVAEAGLTAALVGAGSAVLGPVVGLLADRFGQKPVLLVAGIVNGSALLGLVAALLAEVPTPVLVAVGFAIGASSPQVSPMVRVRWLNMIADRAPLKDRARLTQAALSYESMADEIVFVFGPVIVGLLATLLVPTSPVVVASLLTFVFVSSFALHASNAYAGPRASGSQGGQAPSPLTALLHPRCVLPVLGMTTIGLFFGSTLTSLTGFMGVYADDAQTGLAYGAMGVTSAILALGVVILPDRFTLQWRWLVFAAITAAGALLLPSVTSLTGMIVVLLIMGCGIGPNLVTMFSLAARVAPRGRMTGLMAALSSGVIVGQSAASAITGDAVERAGHGAGFLLVIGASLLMLVLAVLQLIEQRWESVTGRSH